MNRVKLTIGFVVMFGVLNSQTNLVLNGGFESYSVCPTNSNQFQNNVDFWYKANTSTPDYYNSCCTTGCLGTDIPNTGMGLQNTNSGNGFAGIFIIQTSSPANEREYIGTQLINPMILGHNYYVEFFVSLADIERYATSRIGAHFSNSQVFQNDALVINLTPQIQNPFGNFLSDNVNWMKVSGSFIAAGGEQWLTIGNFYNDLSTDTLFVTSSVNKEAYYFIDDVSVIDSTAIGIKEHEKNSAKLHVFPIPAKDEISIEFSELKKGNLVVIDINGKVVMQKSFEAQLLQLDVSALPAGVYFAEAVLENEKKLRQKVVVVR
jgi:hypothetical protein